MLGHTEDDLLRIEGIGAKAIEELKAGNLEFRAAAAQTERALDAYELPEVAFFKEHFMDSFRLTLDEME